MKRYIATMLFLSQIAHGDSELLVSGMYMRYEGGEYESGFIPCDRDEVWFVDGGIEYDKLVKLYNGNSKNNYGEIYVTLEGEVSLINKTEYPNSHYASIFKVNKVVQVGKGQCPNA